MVWRCITRMDSLSKCQARTVKEDMLHEVIVEVINSLIEDSDYLDTLEMNIKEVLNKNTMKQLWTLMISFMNCRSNCT